MKARKKKREPSVVPLHYSLMDELRASPVVPLRPELLTPGLLLAYLGLDAMAGMGANPQECADVSDVLNVASAMLELGLVEDEHGLIQLAKNALGAAYVLHMGAEHLRLTGAGLEAMQGVLTGYSEVVAALPARSFVASVRLAHRRVREILRGMTARGDVVVEI